ncbi:MAG TPA: 2'-5' RNA ligase family protein [Streptosporangiaceae bacterium]|nr:2'-5' RNA ligase family protein [Streptosporangiaceae bacterium]
MAEVVTDRETAVLVQVPEAERVVSPHRSRLDGAAALGVPAHVTVLFPFVPPASITPGVVDALAAAVATVSAFGCEFWATSWFGEDVLYLPPRPDEPFRALTRAVCAAFPGYRPYGGAFADTIPHLTVGERERGGRVADLRAAETAVLSQLPIRFRVDRVWLMAGSAVPGSWHTLAELPLTPG